MHLGEREGDELGRLRERVYGPNHIQDPTEAEISRLAELEAIRLERDAPLLRSESEPAMTSSDRALSAAVEQQVAPSLKSRHPLRVILVFSAAIVGSLLIGFAVGTVVHAPPPDDTLAEFARPQTDEDILIGAAAGEVEPTSTRFIARVDGFDIYLAKPAGYDGVCIVTSSDVYDGSPVIGCAGGSGANISLGSGLTAHLDIIVGDPSGLVAGGKLVSLSENVSAWQH